MDPSPSKSKPEGRKRAKVIRSTETHVPPQKFATSLVVFLAVNIAGYFLWSRAFQGLDPNIIKLGECAQSGAITPQRNIAIWQTVNRKLSTEALQIDAIRWLRDGVRLPTETFDNMGEIGEDDRWNALIPFQHYLRDAFPLVHSNLQLTKVNTFGLLYEWKGSNRELKPLLLAAHQDVVPVENSTLSSWRHHPFSGYFDGERIWGRGSSDDKAGLIGSLGAVELLLSNGFKPERTVILAFGFDEEASGFHGAGYLARAIKEKYGQKRIAMIIDEGAGFYDHFGSVIALPGIAEKGLYNVRIEVKTPGGHSSVPPDHTSIGILSEVIARLESHPETAHLERKEPLFQTLQCVGRHARTVPQSLRTIITWSLYSDILLKLLEHQFLKQRLFKSLVGTTQALDIIRGGVKSNALPEDAWAIVNHRVSIRSSLGDVQRRYETLLKPLASKHNLTFTAFDKLVYGDVDSHRSVLVKNATLHGLEPAPVTPTGQGSGPFQLLAGTIKATYSAHRGLDKADNMIIAPGMMPGNTDTVLLELDGPHIPVQPLP